TVQRLSRVRTHGSLSEQHARRGGRATAQEAGPDVRDRRRRGRFEERIDPITAAGEAFPGPAGEGKRKVRCRRGRSPARRLQQVPPPLPAGGGDGVLGGHWRRSTRCGARICAEQRARVAVRHQEERAFTERRLAELSVALFVRELLRADQAAVELL